MSNTTPFLEQWKKDAQSLSDRNGEQKSTVSTDILDRLRSRTMFRNDADAKEAADEIAALRRALLTIAACELPLSLQGMADTLVNIRLVAGAALSREPQSSVAHSQFGVGA